MLFAVCSYAQQEIKNCKKCIIITEQQQQRVLIVDIVRQQIIWEWLPARSNVKASHLKWFFNISDAKPVYHMKYILVTASGGGVALVRIADKKAVFYAFAGGNTHSAEVLPDGNIVSASSTGNYLTLFKTDTLTIPEKTYNKKIPIEFGHNVVWDKRRQLLWTAAMNKLKAFKYNFNHDQPELKLVETIDLPGTESHDLFPVYAQNKLWLTNITAVYTFDPVTKEIVKTDFSKPNIKSVSSGPTGFPILLSEPQEQWWTNAITDEKGRLLFKQEGLKIYKARWLLPNEFSYSEND